MAKTKQRSKAKRKKTAKTGRPKKGHDVSASDFIRSMPKTLSAPEVVAAGKKKGITFTQQLVYNVRARGVNGAAKKRGPKQPKPAKLRHPRLQPDGVDLQFKLLVVDLGVVRARELLDGVEAAVRDAVG